MEKIKMKDWKKRCITVFIVIITIVTVVFRFRPVKVGSIDGVKVIMKDVKNIWIRRHNVENGHLTFTSDVVQVEDKEDFNEIIEEILNLKIKQKKVGSFSNSGNKAIYDICLHSDTEMETLTIQGNFIAFSFLRDKDTVISSFGILKSGGYFIENRETVNGFNEDILKKHFEEIDKEKKDESKNKK